MVRVRGLSQAFSHCHLQRAVADGGYKKRYHPAVADGGCTDNAWWTACGFLAQSEWTYSLLSHSSDHVSVSAQIPQTHTAPICVPSILLRHNLLLSGNSCSVISTTLWFIFAPRETFLSLEVLEWLLLPLPSPLSLSLFYLFFFGTKPSLRMKAEKLNMPYNQVCILVPMNNYKFTEYWFGFG